MGLVALLCCSGGERKLRDVNCHYHYHHHTQLHATSNYHRQHEHHQQNPENRYRLTVNDYDCSGGLCTVFQCVFSLGDVLAILLSCSLSDDFDWHLILKLVDEVASTGRTARLGR